MAQTKVLAKDLPAYIGKDILVLEIFSGTSKMVKILELYEDHKHMLAKYNHSWLSLPTGENDNYAYYFDEPEILFPAYIAPEPVVEVSEGYENTGVIDNIIEQYLVENTENPIQNEQANQIARTTDGTGIDSDDSAT